MQDAPLWTPSAERIAGTRLASFMDFAGQRAHREFGDYEALYEWSIVEREAFWQSVWDFFSILGESPVKTVTIDREAMPGARWFPHARLNFAENLLRRRDDHPALVFRGEDGRREQVTYAELYAMVARLAGALRSAGVEPGDRVAGFLPNRPETVTAMLATASIGAIWSSCSPDFGTNGVLDRFGQIR